MDIKTLGIDLAKNIFQLHGVNAAGRLELKKTIKRAELLEFIAQLPVCEIVMEACGGANYWARKFKDYGHKVKLISPQFVKPFVKGNKNDYKDAEAIVEASSRPSMRYVTPKTIGQQDMQSLLRSRQGCIQMRTSLSNQLRGLLGEYGVALPVGHASLRRELPKLFDREQTNELSIFFKELLESQYNMLLMIQQQIDEFDIKINDLAKTKDVCKRVQQVEGIGPITAVALAATIGDPNDFKNGRHFAAFVGLVPKQHSSGGKDRLLGISKRGDGYLRTLLIHGARAVLLRADIKSDRKSRWVTDLKERRGSNRACVALANKNARTVLALLKNNEDYKKAA